MFLITNAFMKGARMSSKRIVVNTIVILFLSGVVSAADSTSKKVHPDCTSCHVEVEKDPKTLKAGINDTCLGCHQNSKRNDHSVGVVQKIIPEGLPLDKENKVTCITCHEPHGKGTFEKLLRMEFNTLCRACHKNM